MIFFYYRILGGLIFFTADFSHFFDQKIWKKYYWFSQLLGAFSFCHFRCFFYTFLFFFNFYPKFPRKTYSKLPSPRTATFKLLVGCHLGFGNLKNVLQKFPKKLTRTTFLCTTTVVARQSGPHLGFFSWKTLSKKNVTKSDQTLQ